MFDCHRQSLHDVRHLWSEESIRVSPISGCEPGWIDWTTWIPKPNSSVINWSSVVSPRVTGAQASTWGKFWWTRGFSHGQVPYSFRREHRQTAIWNSTLWVYPVLSFETHPNGITQTKKNQRAGGTPLLSACLSPKWTAAHWFWVDIRTSHRNHGSRRQESQQPWHLWHLWWSWGVITCGSPSEDLMFGSFLIITFFPCNLSGGGYTLLRKWRPKGVASHPLECTFAMILKWGFRWL